VLTYKALWVITVVTNIHPVINLYTTRTIIPSISGATPVEEKLHVHMLPMSQALFLLLMIVATTNMLVTKRRGILAIKAAMPSMHVI
jgi:hypothetical protein